MNLNYYVKKDISEKKILLDVFPKNTEKRLTKYRNTLEEITSKYTNIKEAMQKYIDYKYSKIIDWVHNHYDSRGGILRGLNTSSREIPSHKAKKDTL